MVIVRVELPVPPERLTVRGLRVALGTLEPAGETVAPTLMKPVKPFVPLTVTVETAVPPALIGPVGLAEIEKSSVDSFQPVSG